MFHKCPEHEIIVVRNKKNKIIKIANNKVVFVPPFCKFDYLSLVPNKLSLEKFCLKTRDEKAELLLTADIYYWISNKECDYKAAIEYFLGKEYNEYVKCSKQIILDELKEFVIDDTIARIHKNIGTFTHNFFHKLQNILIKFGLIIKINMKDIYDTEGIIEELSREAASKAIIDACIKLGKPIPSAAKKYLK